MLIQGEEQDTKGTARSRANVGVMEDRREFSGPLPVALIAVSLG